MQVWLCSCRAALAHGIDEALERASHEVHVFALFLEHGHEEGHAAHAAERELGLCGVCVLCVVLCVLCCVRV